ncbi:Uncharacterized protein SCF082_LOCUS30722 [Durusdinium trenchii]|uniref:Uncharacterized protein n=1 Tax=Durusdinium trenchii TaxID=1381693 RepID=A0ABP0N0S1_9DINO
MSSSRPLAAATGRRSHAFLRGLVAALLAWWLSVQAAQAFGYTGGSAKVQARSEGLRTTVGVREKFGSLARKRADGKKFKAAGGGKSRAASSGRKDDESEARILTSRIKEAPAAAELLGILDEAVEVPYFNHIHASAAYHSLATFHRKGTLHDCGESPQILRLHAKVEEVLSKKTVDARATANVFWALAVLIDAAPTIIQLLPTLVKAFRATARSMKAQELANCLWAFAQLKGIAPEVLSLVPTLIAQIPGKACDMKPQELSNSLWASAQLKDVAPDVLDIVPVLVEEIPSKASGMKPQELSNSLWASAHLKDVVPDVLNIVKELVEEIPDKAAEMIPQHLSNCLWASAHLKDVAPDVLNIVPALVEEIPHKAFAMKPQEMSNCLWASAQLKDATPDVLKILPALVEEIPSIATEMKPQELSNSLWASAHLQEVAPRVLNMVSALVAQIQRKVDLNPQQLSNCLWALARLKNVVPDDIVVALAGILPQILGKAGEMIAQDLANSLWGLVSLQVSGLVPAASASSVLEFTRLAAVRFSQLLPRLKGKDLRLSMPTVVWACAQLGLHQNELLTSVEAAIGSKAKDPGTISGRVLVTHYAPPVVRAAWKIQRRSLGHLDVAKPGLGFMVLLVLFWCWVGEFTSKVIARLQVLHGFGQLLPALSWPQEEEQFTSALGWPCPRSRPGGLFARDGPLLHFVLPADMRLEDLTPDPCSPFAGACSRIARCCIAGLWRAHHAWDRCRLSFAFRDAVVTVNRRFKGRFRMKRQMEYHILRELQQLVEDALQSERRLGRHAVAVQLIDDDGPNLLYRSDAVVELHLDHDPSALEEPPGCARELAEDLLEALWRPEFPEDDRPPSCMVLLCFLSTSNPWHHAPSSSTSSSRARLRCGPFSALTVLQSAILGEDGSGKELLSQLLLPVKESIKVEVKELKSKCSVLVKES